MQDPLDDRRPLPLAAPADEDCGHPHHHLAHHVQAPGPRAANALIGARGLSFKHNGRSILQAISLDIHKGEIVTLIGPNGAGKTTLVRTLIGLLKPTEGELWRAPDLVVGYAPQRFDLDKTIPMTVPRFVAMGSATATSSEIDQALKDVGASKLDDRQLSELSGGELQRVILARALVRKPQLLVLDEPVRGVDYAGEAELYTLIGTLRTQHNLGVLLVSHDLHVVMAQSDRVVCINRHICCSGVPETVAQHPEYARLFGAQTARAFGLYHHHHDHRHDLAGEPQPAHRVGPRNLPEA